MEQASRTSANMDGRHSAAQLRKVSGVGNIMSVALAGQVDSRAEMGAVNDASARLYVIGKQHKRARLHLTFAPCARPSRIALQSHIV